MWSLTHLRPPCILYRQPDDPTTSRLPLPKGRRYVQSRLAGPQTSTYHLCPPTKSRRSNLTAFRSPRTRSRSTVARINCLPRSFPYPRQLRGRNTFPSAPPPSCAPPRTSATPSEWSLSPPWSWPLWKQYFEYLSPTACRTKMVHPASVAVTRTMWTPGLLTWLEFARQGTSGREALSISWAANKNITFVSRTKPTGVKELDASFAEISWQAMILRESSKTLICGGAIIGDEFVLTSAGCVNG